MGSAFSFFHVALDMPKKATVKLKRKKMIQKICGTYPFIMPRFTIKVNAIEGHLCPRFASPQTKGISRIISGSGPKSEYFWTGFQVLETEKKILEESNHA